MYPGSVYAPPNINTTVWEKTVGSGVELLEPALRSEQARREFIDGMKGNPVSRQLTLVEMTLISDNKQVTLDFKGIATEAGQTILTWALLPSVEGNFECIRTYWPNLILTYEFPVITVNLGTTFFFGVRLGVTLPFQPAPENDTPISIENIKLPWE